MSDREEPHHAPLKINGITYSSWMEYKLTTDSKLFSRIHKYHNQYEYAKYRSLKGKIHPNRKIQSWHKY